MGLLSKKRCNDNIDIKMAEIGQELSAIQWLGNRNSMRQIKTCDTLKDNKLIELSWTKPESKWHAKHTNKPI